jgi:pyruvate/2-oxoglutarate dehydrogenase complex dihydrolipoamide dehydrogenase (E3) component
MKQIKTDICVIGGGSGGLSVAAGAIQMGAKVVLCEGGKMGGDCLNYGCVPSKAMIEASRIIHSCNKAKEFGIDIKNFEADYKKVQAHVANVIAKIGPHDSVERFESLGVNVIQDYAHIIDKKTVQAGDIQIKAKYIVLATGSRAKIFPIEGLEDIDYLTNETIFSLDKQPEHLLVMGGGPIGVELAQAHALLGSKVTILEAESNILGPVDNDCRQVLLDEFKKLGIDVVTKAKVSKVSKQDAQVKLETNIGNYSGSHLLVATGRQPNIEKLNLDKVGIKHSAKGINVDTRLRTNYKNIYAIGDLASQYQFTHTAGYHAGIVIQNILFKLPAKVNYSSFPWAVYTTPEIAHTGMAIKQAEEVGATILSLPYESNDRAQANLSTNGLLKIAVNKRGYILGASIVGEQAGELITQWTLAIRNKLKIKQMASHIVPYPTLSELNKRIAGSYFTPSLYSEKVKKIVRFLLKF